MSSSENLLKAALSQISTRLSKSLVETANELSQKAKETPEQLKVEWEILKKEIVAEAERLENEKESASNGSQENDPTQLAINSIRKKVIDLIDKIEEEN